MARSKTHKSEEHYRGQIRALKGEIRRLQQQLRYYERRDHLVDTRLEVEEDTQPIETTKESSKTLICPKCKYEMVEIDLGRKFLYKCSNINCEHRKTKEKHG